MINRDTPSEELLVTLHGLYEDYLLMKIHTEHIIGKYVREELGVKTLHTIFDYDNNRELRLTLKTTDIIPSDKLEMFTITFNLEVVEVHQVMPYRENYWGNLWYDDKLREEGFIQYIFRRVTDNNKRSYDIYYDIGV